MRNDYLDPEFQKWLKNIPIDLLNAMWIVYQAIGNTVLESDYYVELSSAPSCVTKSLIKDEDIYKFGYKLNLNHKQVKSIIDKGLDKQK